MWRSKIKSIGIREAAKAMGLSYEAVRKWVNNGNVPGKVAAGKLLAYLREIITAREYEEIKASIISEMIKS
jgi:hypothetical protein